MEKIFFLKIGREGFVRFKNLQVNMVEPALSEKEIYYKVKLRDN